MSIHFGTSGWRAIIADEFTFANVRKVARAIARYVRDHKLQHQGVVVGYDTRFLSEEFARACAGVLTEQNIPVFLTNRDTPTPVIAYHILSRQAAGGINITASHNPPEYNGIKFSPAYGGPAPLEVTEEIENNIKRSAQPQAKGTAALKIFDPRQAYLQRLRQLVDFAVIRRGNLRIGVDVLYGTGRGYLDYLLKGAGCKITVLHDRVEPFFGGLPPEPARLQLSELRGLVRQKHLHLGLAVDGDADRFGIVDRDGTSIGANEVISLLTAHLIQTRPRKKSVARTVATTHMVDALARPAGLQVIETPVGFKYIGQEIAKGSCLIGGEESGGLSIAGHIPEKDGILACLLIAELVAARKKPLGAILKELFKAVGPFYSGRSDFHLDEPQKQRFLRRIKVLAKRQSFPGKRLERFVGLDGYKFIFAGGSWLMLRVSGTEPVVRCYYEARFKRELNGLLKLGREMIK